MSQVKRSFAEEMVSSLSAIDEEYDWDVVTYHYLRRGRECIIPEVGMELYRFVAIKGFGRQYLSNTQESFSPIFSFLDDVVNRLRTVGSLLQVHSVPLCPSDMSQL